MKDFKGRAGGLKMYWIKPLRGPVGIEWMTGAVKKAWSRWSSLLGRCGIVFFSPAMLSVG